MNIAIIGCGEVGYLYATAFIEAGYPLQLYTPRPTEKVLNLTTKKNIILHTEIGTWLENANIVISCVPSSASLPVAKEAISFLKQGTTFADMSSSSANDKRTAAALYESQNISFVDAVITGSIDLMGIKAPLLCSGNGSEKIADIMRNVGASVRILPHAKAGDAAYLKLLRSVFMKGLAALTIECVTAAELNGVKNHLYEILSDLDNSSLPDFLDMLLRNHVTHACRQRHEITDAIAQLKSSSLPVQLLPAIEELFATTCEQTKLHPIENKNPTTEEALQWLIDTRRNAN